MREPSIDTPEDYAEIQRSIRRLIYKLKPAIGEAFSQEHRLALLDQIDPYLLQLRQYVDALKEGHSNG